MDKPIQIPRNQTALMQHMQRLVSCGHYYWTADCIPKSKIAGFIDKWSSYGLRADAPVRAYRKSVGRASVHLCLHPSALTDEEAVQWWMLSTAGKLGLSDQSTPGVVRDTRTIEGRLRFGDYELVQQLKTVVSNGKTKRMTTWTWRLTTPRYKEWEALLICHAKERQFAQIEGAIACLQAMPMFAGIRSQVIRLVAETNRMLTKVKAKPIDIPSLPVMRMLPLWSETSV
jgi:hypothetical protein